MLKYISSPMFSDAISGLDLNISSIDVKVTILRKDREYVFLVKLLRNSESVSPLSRR